MQPAGRGDQPAEVVVHVEVADHPAAAVVVDEQRRRRVGRGRRRDVEAGGDRPVRPGDLDAARTSAIADRPLARADPGLVGASAARASSTLRPAKKPLLPDQRARVSSAWVSVGERLAVDRRRLAEEQAARARREPAGPFEDAVLDRHRQSRQLSHRRAGYST